MVRQGKIEKEIMVLGVVALGVYLLYRWNKNRFINAAGDDGKTNPFPEYDTPVPLGSFQLCCIWGCAECTYTWPWNRPKRPTRKRLRRR